MTQLLSLSEQLTFCTLRLECTLANNVKSTGTAFLYMAADNGSLQVPIIITNKHVVSASLMGRFRLHAADGDGDPNPNETLWVQLDNFESRWVPHPDPTVDLCALNAAPIINEAIRKGKPPFYKTLTPAMILSDAELAELSAVEDILMIGYPNGLWDSANNQPITRRGITATHPALDYEKRREFMIDAACFPGSSGSPVLLYNAGFYVQKRTVVTGTRAKFLGVLYAGPQHTAAGDIVIASVPTVDKPMAISRIPNNLGNVIRASQVRAFEPLFAQFAPNQWGADPLQRHQVPESLN